MRPSLYNTVGGLKTTTLPGGRSALRNAAVTSREAMVLHLDEAAQDRMNLNIQVSRYVVVIFPDVSLVWLPQVTILILYFSGLMVKTTFAGSSM